MLLRPVKFSIAVIADTQNQQQLVIALCQWKRDGPQVLAPMRIEPKLVSIKPTPGFSEGAQTTQLLVRLCTGFEEPGLDFPDSS